MGIFDGLFGASDDANPAAFSLKDKMADPTFLAGLQILSNSMVKRPLTQQVSPFEGVAPLLMKAGEDQNTRDALTMVLTKAGFSPEEAARMSRNPQIAKLALDQKQNEKTDAALSQFGNGPSMFGGAAPGAPSAAPAAGKSSEAAPVAPGMDGILQLARKDSGDNYGALTYKKDKTPGGTADLENMTLAQVYDLQDKMPSLGHASTAVGAYQTIKPTLQAAVSALGLDPNTTKFDRATQDAIAAQLVKGRGYDKFVAGELPADQFASNLSKEWAILQGPNGRGAYDGVNGNKASVPASSVMAALQPQGQGLSRLTDAQVVPPAPGVPVASRGPDGALSYAPTDSAKPVQVASSDPNFVPAAAPKPEVVAEAQRVISAPPPPQPDPNMGATTQRAQAIQSFQYWSKAMVVAGRLGDKGKGLMERAKAEIDMAKEFLKPTDLQKQIEAMQQADPATAAIIRSALPNNDPTSTREYDFYAKQEKAAGRAPKSFEDWDIFRRRAQNQNELGSIPAGYKVSRGADGSMSMEPVPGSPADREAKAAAAKEEQVAKQTKTVSDVVTQDIDRALDLTKSAKIPVTGGLGNLAKSVPGTAAHDVNNLLTGIKANIAFDRLQQMRAASPTGGALGAVSDSEGKLLQAAYGSLEQSQTQEQFTRNLARLKRLYTEVVHGVDGGDAAPAGAPAPGGTGLKIGESKAFDGGVTIKRVK